jgi:hypothetical protein
LLDGKIYPVARRGVFEVQLPAYESDIPFAESMGILPFLMRHQGVWGLEEP